MAHRPDIEAIEKRLQAVTGSTWAFHAYNDCGDEPDSLCGAGDLVSPEAFPYHKIRNRMIAYDVMPADALFIVSARNTDVRDLLAWIRHLEANAGVAGQTIPTS